MIVSHIVGWDCPGDDARAACGGIAHVGPHLWTRDIVEKPVHCEHVRLLKSL